MHKLSVTRWQQKQLKSFNCLLLWAWINEINLQKPKKKREARYAWAVLFSRNVQNEADQKIEKTPRKEFCKVKSVSRDLIVHVCCCCCCCMPGANELTLWLCRLTWKQQYIQLIDICFNLFVDYIFSSSMCVCVNVYFLHLKNKNHCECLRNRSLLITFAIYVWSVGAIPSARTRSRTQTHHDVLTLRIVGR